MVNSRKQKHVFVRIALAKILRDYGFTLVDIDLALRGKQDHSTISYYIKQHNIMFYSHIKNHLYINTYYKYVAKSEKVIRVAQKRLERNKYKLYIESFKNVA